VTSDLVRLPIDSSKSVVRLGSPPSYGSRIQSMLLEGFRPERLGILWPRELPNLAVIRIFLPYAAATIRPIARSGRD